MFLFCIAEEARLRAEQEAREKEERERQEKEERRKLEEQVHQKCIGYCLSVHDTKSFRLTEQNIILITPK